MNLYTVVGDPHAVPSNLNEIGTLFDILEDIGKPVVILGDLLDTKEIVRGRVFNFVMKRLRISKLNFIILVGNHDYFNLECKEHSLEALKELENVTVVDKPLEVENILFMPYYDDLEAFKKVISDTKAEILFMHQGVIGFDYGNGYIADGNGHGELPPATFKKFKRIISGHFHKFAQKDNLTFLGTPFSHSFGETDQDKFIAIYKSESDELGLYKTPFRKHRTLIFNLTDVPPENADNKEESLRYEFSHLDPDFQDHWRVKLIGTEMDINGFKKDEFPGVKWLEEPTDSEQIEDVILNDTDSNEQKFSTWSKEIKGLDEEVLKMGLELLEESK